MAHLEIRMPTEIARGAKGGPMRNTVVVKTLSGAEQRIALWEQSQRKWDVSHALRTNEQRDALISFFEAAEGRANTFRFKDLVDYRVSEPAPMVPLTSNTFQIVKRYSSGSAERVRTIAKPAGDDLSDTAATQASSTVRVYTDTGSEITGGWTVDLTTGIVTFASAPGLVPQATCEYDCKARFDVDHFTWDHTETTYGTWSQVSILEVPGT